MLKHPLRVNMNNEGLAVSLIIQSLSYILISIVFNPFERRNRSAEMLISVSV